MSYQVQIIIQIVVGFIFIQNGIFKFIVPEFGYERFATLGLPLPFVLAPLVGCLEILSGGLLLYNLHIRKAITALLFVMFGAFFFTKIPILMNDGIVVALHQARLEIVLTTLLCLLLVIKIRQIENEEMYV
ncbi:DoxX family protein [Anaerobacillus alkaliphilus]|nr:DoxX family membrane protein [Anaerobacillus alkaliphilus]